MFSNYLKNKHNKFITSALILVFILPLVAAHLLYATRDHFTFKTTESGKLFSPPIHVQSFPFFNNTFLGKWQIIYISSIPCNASCQTMMSTLEKIHSALGKEKYRVEYRMVMAPKNMQILPEGDIAIVDPQGWLIMHYPVQSDLKGLLRDMRQLLRLSHVG